MKKLTHFVYLGLLLFFSGAAALAESNQDDPAGVAGNRGPAETSAGFDQFYYLPMTMLHDEFPCRYQEVNGTIIMEVESATPDTTWWEFNNNIPGFTGSGFYRWIGPDLFGDPGVGVLNYPFYIDTPGDFLLRIHNYHDHPAHDQQNDVWVSLDGIPWMKLFSYPNYVWTWHSEFDPPGPAITEARYDNVPAGNHLFQISARSFNFRIDRITLYRPGSDGLNLNVPPSPCN